MTKLSLPEQRRAVLQASGWFAGLPDDLQTWLADTARPLALQAGQCLFARGAAASGLYYVVDGAIRITNTSADGREALLALAESPMWFGESGLFDGAAHDHDASAENTALLLHAGQGALLDLLAREPRHWRAFGVLLAQKLRLAFIGLESAALLPPSARLARRLVAIAVGYGDARARSKRVIEVQQGQLAAMLALSRQTVNQILKGFEARGFVRLSRGSIEILDFEQFRRFAAEL